MKILTLTKTAKDNGEFIYSVLGDNGEILVSRTSRRDYVACFVSKADRPEGAVYGGPFYFGRPGLIGKGDSKKWLQNSAQYVYGVALVETYHDPAVGGCSRVLTRYKDGSPSAIAGVPVFWYETPREIGLPIGYSNDVAVKASPASEPIETPADPPAAVQETEQGDCDRCRSRCVATIYDIQSGLTLCTGCAAIGNPPVADTADTLADAKVILFRMAGGEILTKTPKGFYLEPADFSFTERVNQAAALQLIREGEIVIEREATLTTFYVLPAAGPVPTPAAATVETAAELVERLAGELDALAEVNSYPVAVRSNRCDPPQMLFIDRETLNIDSAFDVKTVNEISRGRLIVETHKIGQRLQDAKNAKSLSGLAILKSLIEG